MISVGAAANLCCSCCYYHCTNKTKTCNITTYSHSNKVVVRWNWKKHLITSTSGSGESKAWWCNDNPPPPPPPASTVKGGGRRLHAAAAAAALHLLLLLLIFSETAVSAATIEQSMDTYSNVPQTLSGEDRKKARIKHPKSRDAERCTIKCVTTCIRGGAGEGPLNARRPLVVFKQGFRSRQYCLVECSDICNLIKDGEDGP